jgi:hypothetical protein
MLYFRFVANTFVLGVGEVKLWEARRIVKGKQEVRGVQYSLYRIGEFDVKPRQNAKAERDFIAGSLPVTWQESEAIWLAFDLLRVVSYADGMAAW